MGSPIGKFVEGAEREGFEPSVNKSLHSSSNATPSTTRPSLLHNDYVPATEAIASHSHSIRFLDSYGTSIRKLYLYIESFSSNFHQRKTFPSRLVDKENLFVFEKLLKTRRVYIYLGGSPTPFFFFLIFLNDSSNEFK